MTSRTGRHTSRAVAAGWKPATDLSPEGKQFTATHPSLYLHVYCNFSGVNIHGYVDWLDARGKLQRLEIGRATFRPPEVSQRLVVEWGQRCLTRWLEDTLPGETKA